MYVTCHPTLTYVGKDGWKSKVFATKILEPHEMKFVTDLGLSTNFLESLSQTEDKNELYIYYP